MCECTCTDMYMYIFACECGQKNKLGALLLNKKLFCEFICSLRKVPFSARDANQMSYPKIVYIDFMSVSTKKKILASDLGQQDRVYILINFRFLKIGFQSL